MADQVPLSEIGEKLAGDLVSIRNWGDASFISLPLVYPSGSSVAVRLTYVHDGIRVSDAGFAYREAESFGAGRSFANTARSIADQNYVEVGRRAIYVDARLDELERAIIDVSSTSHAVAEKIVANVSVGGEAAISEALHAKLDRIFPSAVEHDSKIVGASSTEWDVTALAKLDGRVVVFQAVPNYPVSIYKASTAFHDLAALEDRAPGLVSVVSSKAEMGKGYSILAQIGRVVELGQGDESYRQASIR